MGHALARTPSSGNGQYDAASDLFVKEAERFVALGYTSMETIVAATRTGAEVSAAGDIGVRRGL